MTHHVRSMVLAKMGGGSLTVRLGDEDTAWNPTAPGSAGEESEAIYPWLPFRGPGVVTYFPGVNGISASFDALEGEACPEGCGGVVVDTYALDPRATRYECSEGCGWTS